MEAATPLRSPDVRVLGDRLLIDGLVVADGPAVRLARERAERGEDPAAVVIDAIEIGARVLDREQTAADTEFVRNEFEKVSREVQSEFGERARLAGEALERQLDEVFGPENGHLAAALSRHFSDESTGAVQHKVRAAVDETMAAARKELLTTLFDPEGSGPFAEFRKGTADAIGRATEVQRRSVAELSEKIAGLEKELALQREAESHAEELEAERERGTAKGRTYEEAVFAAVDRIAAGQQDDAHATGDTLGADGKKGDVVVDIDGCLGPARGRVAFEAKDRRLTKPEALKELDGAMRDREAEYAVLVVPSEEELPAKTQPLREVNGDKLFVVYDPDDGPGGAAALELAYRLARARVLAKRSGGEGIDTVALAAHVERAVQALDHVRTVKTNLTKARKNLDEAGGVVEGMAATVRSHLDEIDRLVQAAPSDDE
ncbi:MAG: hypothetical protein U0R70_07190 [Solirubrobacteraceae bacterium]